MENRFRDLRKTLTKELQNEQTGEVVPDSRYEHGIASVLRKTKASGCTITEIKLDTPLKALQMLRITSSLTGAFPSSKRSIKLNFSYFSVRLKS